MIGAQAKSSSCGGNSKFINLGIPLHGGFNVYGAGAQMRITLDLKPHYSIKVKFVFMKIDSWDNEVAFLRIDNNEVWKRAFVHN